MLIYKLVNLLFFKCEMSSSNKSRTGWVIALLVILIIAVIVICLVEREKHKKAVIRSVLLKKRADDKEGFAYFNTSTGAYVAKETGAVRGPGIITNGMVRNKPSSEIVSSVEKEKEFAEEANFGATYQPNGLDKLVKNQIDIQRINERNDGKIYSQSDLQEISSKIQTSASSADNSLFSRAGAQVTEMLLLPSATVGVIDQDFVPERDRNNRVVVAGSAVPIQGYQFDVARLPVELSKGWMKSNTSTTPDYNTKDALKNSMAGLKNASFVNNLGVTSSEIKDPSLLKSGNSFLISGQ